MLQISLCGSLGYAVLAVYFGKARQQLYRQSFVAIPNTASAGFTKSGFPIWGPHTKDYDIFWCLYW